MKKFYKKINWLIIIISALTSLVLTFIFLLLPNTNSALFFSSLIPNLVAVLVGLVVVYYFFKLLGISPNDELKQDIRDVLAEHHNLKFEAGNDINLKFNFQNYLNTAKTIEVISLSAYNLISEYRTELTQAIIRGCDIRLIIVQPKSSASKLVSNWQKNQELKKDLESVEGRFKQIISDINNESKSKGFLDVRGINWIPSTSLIIIDKTKHEAVMRLKVYPLNIDLPLSKINTHMLIDKSNQPELFENFVNQFELLWQKSNQVIFIK